MDETREAALWAWALGATMAAAWAYARFRLAEHFGRKMRDGWRQEWKSHQETLSRGEAYAQAKAARMQAEADLVNALKQGAKPEAQA